MKLDKDFFNSVIKEKLLSENKIPDSKLWNQINNELKFREKKRKRNFLFLLSSLIIILIPIVLIIFSTLDSPERLIHKISKNNSAKFPSKIKTKKNTVNTSKAQAKLKNDVFRNNLNPSLLKNNLLTNNQKINSTSTLLIPIFDKKFNQGKFNFKNSSVLTEVNAPVKEKNLAKIQRELNDSIHVLNFLKPLSTRLMLSKNISQLNLNKDSKLNTMKKNDSFRPVKNLLFLSLDFSPTYSHRSLSNISASEAFYKSLKENEIGLISPNFGINIGVRINEKYFLNTGINKVNYRSTYNSQSCYVAVDTSSSLLSFNTAFDEQYFSDQEFTDNIDDSEENEFNLDELSQDTFSYVNKINLQFLKFPLTLDYGIRTENFKISFSAGFSAYWVTNSFSTIETLGFVSNRKNLLPISNNWLIGGGLGLGLEYFMTEKFSIRSSINSEKSFNAINKSSQFKIVPYWIGVNFQIRYYLN